MAQNIAFAESATGTRRHQRSGRGCPRRWPFAKDSRQQPPGPSNQADRSPERPFTLSVPTEAVRLADVRREEAKRDQPRDPEQRRGGRPEGRREQCAPRTRAASPTTMSPDS